MDDSNFELGFGFLCDLFAIFRNLDVYVSGPGVAGFKRTDGRELHAFHSHRLTCSVDKSGTILAASAECREATVVIFI